MPDVLWLVPQDLPSTPELEEEEALLKLTGSGDNPGFLGIRESMALTNNKEPPECTGEVVFRVSSLITTRNSHRHAIVSTPHYAHINNVNVQTSKLSAEGAWRLARGWATTLAAPTEKARACALLIQGNLKVAGKVTNARGVRLSWLFQRTNTAKHRPQQTVRMRTHRHTSIASLALTLTLDNSHRTQPCLALTTVH